MGVSPNLGMTHKERYLTAIQHKQPDTVPVDCWLDLVHVERILNRRTRDASFFVDKNPAQVKEDMNDLMIQNQRLINEAHRKLGLDSYFVSDYYVYPRGYRPKFIDSNTYVDHLGKVYKIRRDVNVTYWVDGVIKTPEDLDRFEFPDPKDFDYTSVELTVEEAGEEYPVLAWCHLSEMFSYLARGGIDKLVYDLYRNPDFARNLIGKISSTNMGIIDEMIKRGVDVVAVGDDVADTRGPFFPPRIFRQYFYPYLEKLVEMAHRKKVYVMKHSDGNLYPILDDLISLGIDGLHPIEPGAMDLADVKNRYGARIFLRGNVDNMHVLPYGSEEDVRKDVRRCIDAAAKGGGFILAESNSMHANVKTGNIWTMIDEARRYGVYR
jgi:uroporphyrinogen-III decarboxylase